MRNQAILCWMGNAHFLSSYHSFRIFSLEYCVILFIFFYYFFFLVLGGGDVWDQICVYQIITPSINSVTDYLPKGCQFCFSKQIHILISTSLLNVTSVRMLPKGWSQVFLKFLCIRTSYFMCGDKNETRSWKLAM